MARTPRTLFEKLWRRHEVLAGTLKTPATLHIDLCLIHEATLAYPCVSAYKSAGSEQPVNIHTIGAETGLIQPGNTIVSTDRYVSTHGAFGALALGIAGSEAARVLETRCLQQRKPRTLAINVTGKLRCGVTAKDLTLGIMGKMGPSPGIGRVIEYRGETIRALNMEERMTVCSMATQAGAQAGMIAPDETTYAYLAGCPNVPGGDAWYDALAEWRQLPSDFRARFDAELTFDAQALEPMITFGSLPDMVIPVGGVIPEKSDDPVFQQDLDSMGLRSGQSLRDQPVDWVFIGSYTNGRLSDLRDAAALLRGKKIAPGLHMSVTPISQHVKEAAEAEGLDRTFRTAGAQWREPGAFHYAGMNGEIPQEGYAVSTGSDSREGQPGAQVRTLLASPLTAAASAIRGRVTDPRELLY
jgi:3-isopropylmalate/(R)-2-methylmalate dehydratase large subunit